MVPCTEIASSPSPAESCPSERDLLNGAQLTELGSESPVCPRPKRGGARRATLEYAM